MQHDPVDPADIWADPKTAIYPDYPQSPEPDVAEAAVVLARLATRPDIPVATSISGQGSLAETHPLALGVVGSNGGTDETWEMMQAADLVIIMGVRAGSTTTSRWEAPTQDTRIVHFDSDPMVICANYQTEVGVVGDLRLSLQLVNAVLDAHLQGVTPFGGAKAVADIKRRKFEVFRKHAESDETPIRPERLIDAMMKALPEDAIVVSDPGTTCPYFSAYYEPPKPGRHFITNRAHGDLGYALSTALGA